MLLDTASMYFRAFFGVPEIKAPDGTPVNAVRGLLDFISRLVDDYRPTTWSAAGTTTGARSGASTCCRRTRRTAWSRRSPAAPDVEEVPDPLEVQIPIILDVLDALGICVIGADGYEADDVIGTLATGAGQPVDIVTGDRDLFQLVDDERRRPGPLHRPRRRQPRAGRPTTGCATKYGIDARQYADFATLRGDASDGLPGVAGRRREDRGDAAPAVRRHGRHRRRRRRPGRRPGPRPARQDQGGRRLPRGRARRWSPSPATSTSAAPTPRSRRTPADPERARRARGASGAWRARSSGSPTCWPR